jgi:MHS family proline/betaine transporter-like MFS transporter
VIAQHFFPSTDPSVQLIAAFGAFAAGFLMRPLGGVVFGHIGDRFGRKAALTISVLAMAIPTFCIGILPGYDDVGWWAPALLVVCRMVQGLSVGGEYTTSIVYLVEGAHPNRRGMAGSWSGVGATTGVLLGSAVGALTTTLLQDNLEALHTWGWRLPFLLGLGVGLGGLMVRRGLPESPPAPPESGRLPLVEAFVTEWRAILQVIGLNLLNGVGFYLIFVYLVTFMTQMAKLPEPEALDVNTFNMVVLLIVVLLGGWLSDRHGRKPVLLFGGVGVLMLAWPMFWLLHHDNAWLGLIGQFGLAVFAGLFLGVIPVTMVEAFPAKVRCSAISVGYNICLGLLGGTAPMVATFLIATTGYALSPAFYLMAAAAISVGVVLTLRETSRDPLK